jgi:hypothetical protein
LIQGEIGVPQVAYIDHLGHTVPELPGSLGRPLVPSDTRVA